MIRSKTRLLRGPGLSPGGDRTASRSRRRGKGWRRRRKGRRRRRKGRRKRSRGLKGEERIERKEKRTEEKKNKKGKVEALLPYTRRQPAPSGMAPLPGPAALVPAGRQVLPADLIWGENGGPGNG